MDVSKINGYDIKDKVSREKIGILENSVVNVKSYGVKGDGVTDDTTAIQDCINDNPLRTIYFPDGTYLVSEHLYTNATDTEKVYLKLDKNAIIKASNDFSDDFVIIIGETGTATAYGSSSNKSGIEGGTIDCNNRTSGVNIQNIHLGKILDISIINSNLIGIQIDRTNNSSSDIYVNNVDLRGTDGNNVNSIGLLLNGGDNNIDMLRTTGFHVGIKILSGGNYFSNCHPLYSIQLETTNYNTSIGYEIQGQNNYFSDCYSDNFSTCFQVNGEYKWIGNNLFCFWYNNESDKEHTAIKLKYYRFKGKISGLSIEYPENGINRGLFVDDSEHSTYSYPDYYYTLNNDTESGSITNINMTKANWLRLSNKLSDGLLLSNIQNNNTLTLRGKDDTLLVNKWYPLMIFSNDIISTTLNSPLYEINFKIGEIFSMDMLFRVESDVLKTKNLKTNYNINGISVTFALGKITELKSMYILYFKINSFGSVSSLSNNIYTTTIKNPGLGNNMILIPRTSVYNVESLNGIDTIQNLLTTGRTVKNLNTENGIFQKLDYATTHVLPSKDETTDRSCGYILFIHWGSSTCIYSFCSGTVMPLNTDNIQTNDTINMSYDQTNNTLTITTNTASNLYYVKF